MYKLLQISITCNHGSTGKIAEQIGMLMKGRGWDVYICHGARFVNRSQLKTYQIQNKFGEYLHVIFSRLFDADGLGSVFATYRLISHIKRVKPDIVHIHNLHGYYVNYKILMDYLNSSGIPLVMTIHDCWTFTGHCVHFITANCNKWEVGCFDCPQVHNTPKSLFWDRSRSNYALKKCVFGACRNLNIVCVSEWLKEMACMSFLKSNSIQCIENGIDTEIFKRYVDTESIVSKYIPCHLIGKFQIIAVGTAWSQDKGLYDYLEFARMLSEEEYLVLVGIDKNKFDIEFPDNIVLVPYTFNQQELAKLYSSSDVVICLSHAETFGLTVAEGYACGTPAVVYNNTSLSAMITPEVGYAVENRNIKAAHDAVLKIKAKGKSSYIDACRRRALECYDKNKRYLDYANLYEKLKTSRD